jgi:hypothetical protein
MAKTKSANAPKTKGPRRATAGPTHEEIALRAYHIYLERGGAPGDPSEDWLRAEAELSAKAKKDTRKPKVVSIAA